jgi:hypothetical protein
VQDAVSSAGVEKRPTKKRATFEISETTSNPSKATESCSKYHFNPRLSSSFINILQSMRARAPPRTFPLSAIASRWTCDAIRRGGSM